MKKFVFLLIFLLTSFCTFSEDYDRFKFSVKDSDLIGVLKTQGWKYTINTKNNLHRFTPATGNDKTFRGDKLKEISFQFNDDGTILSQCFVIDDNFSVASGFYTLLCEFTDE